MSAPALNAAFTVAPQTPSAAGTAQPGGAAGAFEALMGALFGTQDSLGAVLFAGAAPAADGAKTEKADAQDGETAVTDEAQALAGLFAVPLPLAIPAPMVTAPEGGGDSTPAGADAASILPTSTDADALAQALIAEPGKAADPKPVADATPKAPPAAPTPPAAARAQAMAAEPAPLGVTPEPIADAPEAQQLAAAEILPPPPPHAEDRRATPARRETPAAVHAARVQDAPPQPVVEPKADAGKPDLQVAAGDEPAMAAVEAAAPDAKAADPQGPAPAQPAAPAAAPHATLAAATPVRGSPETVANLTAQIVKKLEGRSTRFDVELDPAGLGRVDVRVEIGQHGKITAALTFDNPQAANELRSRGGELSRALEQAGFDLSGGLSFDVADQRGQQGQGAGAQNDNGGAWRGKAFQAALDQAGDTLEAAVNGGLSLQRRWNAGVDIRI